MPREKEERYNVVLRVRIDRERLNAFRAEVAALKDQDDSKVVRRLIDDFVAKQRKRRGEG